MSEFQQQQADLMLDLSRQHEQDSVLASQRLHALVAKKDAAEASLASCRDELSRLQLQLAERVRTHNEQVVACVEDASAQLIRCAMMGEQQKVQCVAMPARNNCNELIVCTLCVRVLYAACRMCKSTSCTREVYFRDEQRSRC